MKKSKAIKKFFKFNFFSSFFMVVMILFLYLPLLVVFIFSFNNTGLTGSFDGFSFGFKYYANLFKQSLFLRAIFLSFLISILSTIISVVIGTLAAISFQRLSKRSQAVINFFNNIPLINADIIIGASLMILFIALACPFGFFTLLAAHISFCVPYVTLTVLAKLKSINKHYLDASLDLGATPFYTIKKVIIPLIKNGVYAGAAIAFAMSIDDFIISYFSSGSLQNYSVFIYTMRHFQPFVNAFGVLLIIFLVILFVLFKSLTKLKTIKNKKEFLSANNNSKKHLKILFFQFFSKAKIKTFFKFKKFKLMKFSTFFHLKNFKFWKSALGIGLILLSVIGLTVYYVIDNSHVISLAVWSEYFTDQSIINWERQSGWRVKVVTYSSNEELRNKLNTTAFDVMMPSDYFVSSLKKQNLIQPLNSLYINSLINKNNDITEYKIDPMFKMVNDVYTNFQIDNEGDYLTSSSLDSNNGYFYPAFIQNTQLLVKDTITPTQNISPWKELWKGIKSGKTIILQDDPRLIFALGKINIYLDGSSGEYYNDCFPKNSNPSLVNFTSSKCVSDVYNYIKGPIRKGTVSIHSDDIDTYLNNQRFDYALVYNSSFVESVVELSNSFKYYVKNAYLPDISKNKSNKYKSQMVNSDGFVINKNLSKPKKEVVENLISYLLSYNSGVDSIDNYYFSIADKKLFHHYFKKFHSRPKLLKSLYWLDNDPQTLPPDFASWQKLWTTEMFNPTCEVLEYNLNDEIANYYNLLLKT